MKIEKVNINLKNNNYLIYVGFNIFQSNNFPPILKKNDTVILITNNTIDKIWKKVIINFFQKYEVLIDEFIIPDGEIYKNLHSVEKILSFLLKKSHDRNAILIALGGGVIGDLVGFTASIYQRGIRVIQVPTTLLSQVDAAIGGKTGVNHTLGKNMIGSFWQPFAVISDINFLSTLSKKQLISGLAEIIKYAISFDYSFFKWLEKNIKKILLLDTDIMILCIKKCVELKSKIVSLDEREKDVRMLLNFGHTYGHAIEAHFKYSKWLHGEAVSIGMVIAMKTSEMLGFLNKIDYQRIMNLITISGLPTLPPINMYPKDYLKYMIRDKKNYSGKIRLILPISIGKVKIFNDVNQKIILSAIESCMY